MTVLRTIIVDDEPIALGLLKSKLSKNPRVDIVAECKNGREAIEAALEHNADIMFLDIEMPGINGMEVVKNLQADVMPLIVFTTAFEQYAIDAFDLHAVDYILKPIDQERIDRAIERARTRLDSEGTRSAKPSLLSVIESIQKRQADPSPSSPLLQEPTPKPGELPKIVIKDRDEITLLNQQDIAWLDAAGDYVCLHANGETHIKRSTLKELLDELDPEQFKRVHRSTIVNLKFIEKVIPHTKGEFFLVLEEDHKIKVSRNYRAVIKQFLQDGV